MTKPTGLKVAPMKTTEIRSIADQVRKILGLPNGFVNIVEILEVAFRDHYNLCSITDMGSDHGLTFPESGEIRIREDVYIGACDDKGRDRFTIAHEMGHFFLHPKIGLARSGKEAAHQWYEDSEWQANTFAAELLMPLNEIIQHCNGPDNIAERFGVTIEAATIRWKKLTEQGELKKRVRVTAQTRWVKGDE